MYVGLPDPTVSAPGTFPPTKGTTYLILITITASPILRRHSRFFQLSYLIKKLVSLSGRKCPYLSRTILFLLEYNDTRFTTIAPNDAYVTIVKI